MSFPIPSQPIILYMLSDINKNNDYVSQSNLSLLKILLIISPSDRSNEQPLAPSLLRPQRIVSPNKQWGKLTRIGVRTLHFCQLIKSRMVACWRLMRMRENARWFKFSFNNSNATDRADLCAVMLQLDTEEQELCTREVDCGGLRWVRQE